MKLDLTELNRGVVSELTKSAMQSVGMPAGIATNAGMAAAKGAGGFTAKKLPIIGGLVHGGLAINDARNGDWTGAGMNAAAGVAGLIPHPAATATMWGLDAANAARHIAPTVSNMIANKKQTGIMDTVGKYAPLAMAGMATLGGGGNRPPQQMGYNPYAPRPRSILDTTQMDPHSLGAPQMFAEKLAAHLQKKSGIVDAFAGAAGRKAVDSVLSAAATPAVDQAAQHAKEKEVELTSKYPEIEHMLKNEQNKAYLEKLLKE